MPGRRSYGDPCGIARALDVVGERWSVLVVRELMFGPKRFSDLRAGLPGIASDVLTQRVRELEQAGVLRRETLPRPAAAKVYALTDRGRELEPILTALGRWGSREPIPAGTGDLGPDAFVLALRTLFDPAVAGAADLTVGLRLGPDRFRLTVRAGGLDVDRGETGGCDAVVTADPASLAGVLWERRTLAGPPAVTIEGDRRSARRFLRMFPRPRG